MKIICRDVNTGEQVTFNSIAEVLEEINRDRSEDWTDYDKTDWQEGLEEFTEYKLIEIISDDHKKEIEAFRKYLSDVMVENHVDKKMMAMLMSKFDKLIKKVTKE